MQDIFMIWLPVLDSSQNLFNLVNSLIITLTFTVETETDRAIPFLDVTFIKERSWRSSRKDGDVHQGKIVTFIKERSWRLSRKDRDAHQGKIVTFIKERSWRSSRKDRDVHQGKIRSGHRVYRKRRHTDQCFPFHSNHPPHVKRGVVQNRYHRATTICEEQQEGFDEIVILWHDL